MERVTASRPKAALPPAAILVVVLMLLGPATSCGSAGRIEELLFWDDGSAEEFLTYSSYGLAVFFQAPPWARSVLSVQVYLGNTGASAAFEASILGVTDGEPLQPGPVAGVVGSGDSYPEDAWLELDQAAQKAPDRLDLRAYRELIRNRLMDQWARAIGDQGRSLQLKLGMDELLLRDLQPDEGFLVSQIDGMLTIENLLSLSSLDRFRTLEILARLIRDGIVE